MTSGLELIVVLGLCRFTTYCWFLSITLKTSEKGWFSDVSRGYRKRPAALTGLTTFHAYHIEVICESLGMNGIIIAGLFWRKI